MCYSYFKLIIAIVANNLFELCNYQHQLITRFAAYCRDRKLGGKVSIGTFSDIDSASKSRTSFKLNILKRDEAIIRSIKDGLYECLVEKIMKQYVEIANE